MATPEAPEDFGEGEDAAYCPDCEQWLPCDCDGMPPNMEIRTVQREA